MVIIEVTLSKYLPLEQDLVSCLYVPIDRSTIILSSAHWLRLLPYSVTNNCYSMLEYDDNRSGHAYSCDDMTSTSSTRVSYLVTITNLETLNIL
jgi:hypothetical protein